MGGVLTKHAPLEWLVAKWDRDDGAPEDNMSSSNGLRRRRDVVVRGLKRHRWSCDWQKSCQWVRGLFSLSLSSVDTQMSTLYTARVRILVVLARFELPRKGRSQVVRQHTRRDIGQPTRSCIRRPSIPGSQPWQRSRRFGMCRVSADIQALTIAVIATAFAYILRAD